MLPANGVRIYLALGATDMRKSIDGLSILVSQQLQQDPFTGHLFGFCNRSRTIIKLLYWDRNGICLWQKRLERHVFRWPTREAEVLTIDSRQLVWLLDGLDPLAVKGHSRLEYSTIF
jgi:transposase